MCPLGAKHRAAEEEDVGYYHKRNYVQTTGKVSSSPPRVLFLFLRVSQRSPSRQLNFIWPKSVSVCRENLINKPNSFKLEIDTLLNRPCPPLIPPTIQSIQRSSSSACSIVRDPFVRTQLAINSGGSLFLN